MTTYTALGYSLYMTKTAAAMRNDPAVKAALYAAKWAQEIGLPAGNLWECGITRNLSADFRSANTKDWKAIAEAWAFRLGLSPVPRRIRTLSPVAEVLMARHIAKLEAA